MTIFWAPAALDDFLNVYTHIAVDNPDQARKVVQRIRRAAEGLEDFPYLGRVGDVPGTRERVLSRLPYIIVYTVSEERIEIVRVIHQKQQWPPQETI
jgi:toxin ParE1/3/4